MQRTPWIKIDDLDVPLEVIPGLLDRFNLLPSFLRRLLETKYTNHIKPEKNEQIEFFNGFLRDNKIQDKAALNEWLVSKGLDDKRLDTMLFEKLQIEKFKKNKFESKIDEYFLEKKELLDKVMYSILRVSKKEQATELFTQLKEEESTFSELVSVYSIGSEKKFNGIIGPVELGNLNINLSERLRISKEGQLWPPFEFNNNWVIMRLEKFLPSKLDEAMRNGIRDKMYEEWINIKVLNLLNQVRFSNEETDNSEITSKKENDSNEN